MEVIDLNEDIIDLAKLIESQYNKKSSDKIQDDEDDHLTEYFIL